MDRDTPITELKGVGEKTGRLFGKLDIRTVGELLAAYPRDYEVFGEPVKIGRAVSGEVCAVQGAVSGIPNERRIRNLSILNVVIADESGRLQLTFYNMPFLKRRCARADSISSAAWSGQRAPSWPWSSPKSSPLRITTGS